METQNFSGTWEGETYPIRITPDIIKCYKILLTLCHQQCRCIMWFVRKKHIYTCVYIDESMITFFVIVCSNHSKWLKWWAIKMTETQIHIMSNSFKMTHSNWLKTIGIISNSYCECRRTFTIKCSWQSH